VVVRKRPRSQKEINKNDKDIVDWYPPQTVIVKELKEKVDLTKYIEEHRFIFDQVFDVEVSNQDFYVQTVQPLVSALFLGSKVTCFAYGQTGSGKTHTMMGPPNDTNHEIPGMYLLAANDIFTLMEDDSMSDFSVYISFYEIYCGKLYDLLNNRKQVHARENASQKIKIVGLTEAQITSVDETMEVIDFGLSSRMTGTTAANADSSRSHAVLQIWIKQDNGKLFGKMSFIDLAGSERGADAFDSKKETRMDGAEINKSLLALKECIRALDQSKKHTPFRGSKLTMVLKDSFQGGKCKTVMVANIGPTISCCEHTLNTLRYADRVKELKKENRDTSNTLMLPRQATNSTKYELKRKNSFEGKAKLTGLAAIQSNLEQKQKKTLSTRPQTAAFEKGNPLKKSNLPTLGGGINKMK
jgi:kinesin family member 2/24